jgi:hypothetical protein
MVERKNHPHRHEVVHGRGDQVYLRVSTQGASGSDIDSEVEQWFDLVRPEFAAVLSLPVVGHEQRHGFGISRRFRSTIRSLEADSRHLIAAFEVTLLVLGRPVGEVRYRAVYVPDATGMMRLSEASGPGSLQDFQSMLTIGDDGPSNEFLLPHAFAGLRALALEARRSKSPDLADGLRFLLRQMKPNNSQVRQLKAILR